MKTWLIVTIVAASVVAAAGLIYWLTSSESDYEEIEVRNFKSNLSYTYLPSVENEFRGGPP